MFGFRADGTQVKVDPITKIVPYIMVNVLPDEQRTGDWDNICEAHHASGLPHLQLRSQQRHIHCGIRLLRS